MYVYILYIKKRNCPKHTHTHQRYLLPNFVDRMRGRVLGDDESPDAVARRDANRSTQYKNDKEEEEEDDDDVDDKLSGKVEKNSDKSKTKRIKREELNTDDNKNDEKNSNSNQNERKRDAVRDEELQILALSNERIVVPGFFCFSLLKFVNFVVNFC